MSDAPPFDLDNPDDDILSGVQGDDFELVGRVPLTFDGTTFAEVYSISAEVAVGPDDLNLEPLFGLLNYDNRSDVDRFLDEHARIEPAPEGLTKDANTRGPYYGFDQLRAKLDGMRRIWLYIDAIYELEGDVIDVYYIHLRP